jgi:hypothetical protein
LAFAGFQAWGARYRFSSSDIVSYLDISDAMARGDWAGAVNGYWSPLYPWALYAVRTIFGVTPAWEMQAVKLTNFLLFVVALVGFEVFLRQFLAYYRARPAAEPETLRLPTPVLVVLGYSLFMFSVFSWTRLYSDTPDLLAAGFFSLAAAAVLRVQTRPAGWLVYAGLGAAAGCVYLARAAMLPASLCFVAGAMPPARYLRARWPRVLATVVSFACVAGPYIAELSAQKGRFTFGDAGKLNYVWLVNPGHEGTVYDHHWTGGTPQYGEPVHPPRTIVANPETFEFATPQVGTYPLWTDPSYWNEGLRVRFDLGRQLRVLLTNLNVVWWWMLAYLTVGYLLVVLAARASLAELATGLVREWRLVLPGLSVAAVYMLASNFEHNHLRFQPGSRYLAAPIVLTAFGLLAATRLPDTRRSLRLAWASALVAVPALVWTLYEQGRWDRANAHKFHTNIQWDLASGVAALGVSPGEKVAILGHESAHEYWARLARVKIIAHTPDMDEFWYAEPIERMEWLSALRAAGAEAVVGYSCERLGEAPWEGQWRDIPGTTYCVSLLDSGTDPASQS